MGFEFKLQLWKLGWMGKLGLPVLYAEKANQFGLVGLVGYMKLKQFNMLIDFYLL